MDNAHTAQELAYELATISCAISVHSSGLAKQIDAITLRLAALASQAEPVETKTEEERFQTWFAQQKWLGYQHVAQRAWMARAALTPPAPAQAEQIKDELSPVLLEALQELLSALRFSNRPPTTVREAEAKLDRIKVAAAKATRAMLLAQKAKEDDPPKKGFDI